MASLEQEILKKTGISFSNIPADGKSRKFKVKNSEWHCISFGSVACFGCPSKDIFYRWENGKCEPMQLPIYEKPISPAQLRKEVEIVDIGNKMMDEGTLSGADLDRYIIALERVIKSKKKAQGNGNERKG
jgi:hypothetical protein